jgi:hypothetical protein
MQEKDVFEIKPRAREKCMRSYMLELDQKKEWYNKADSRED